MHQILYISDTSLIAELAERSPIFIQISSNQLSRKNLDVRSYDPTTVRGATFNMRDQLYRGHFSATALSSSPVVSALGSGSDDPGSSPGRGKALCPWDVWEKKLRAPLLGLAKSIHYLCNEFLCFYTFLWYKLQSCAPYWAKWMFIITDSYSCLYRVEKVLGFKTYIKSISK